MEKTQITEEDRAAGKKIVSSFMFDVSERTRTFCMDIEEKLFKVSANRMMYSQLMNEYIVVLKKRSTGILKSFYVDRILPLIKVANQKNDSQTVTNTNPTVLTNQNIIQTHEVDANTQQNEAKAIEQKIFLLQKYVQPLLQTYHNLVDTLDNQHKFFKTLRNIIDILTCHQDFKLTLEGVNMIEKALSLIFDEDGQQIVDFLNPNTNSLLAYFNISDRFYFTIKPVENLPNNYELQSSLFYDLISTNEIIQVQALENHNNESYQYKPEIKAIIPGHLSNEWEYDENLISPPDDNHLYQNLVHRVFEEITNFIPYFDIKINHRQNTENSQYFLEAVCNPINLINDIITFKFTINYPIQKFEYIESECFYSKNVLDELKERDKLFQLHYISAFLETWLNLIHP